MAEVERKICGVFVMKDGRICIEKLHLGKQACSMTLEYEYTMNWVTLNSSEMMMRKKCLYVGPKPNGSFAETCCVNDMSDSIYFNKFYRDGGVVYSMSRVKYHSIEGEYTSIDSSGLTAMGYNSTWIKPPRGTWIKPISDDHDDSDVWLSFF
ncbi:hypothetical protein BUALT_Bualt17G0089400 [Buddleja alternifolia]|uniref:DUF295 domain-containing protein n=1 Tax=Buddleja alternifolia TaxID=168488 RepID=A0AAV6WFJ8_9LAMI|nr:hypothetical protein BUALT_Bualt17G0089400 [Buddleja alternifolia]